MINHFLCDFLLTTMIQFLYCFSKSFFLCRAIRAISSDKSRVVSGSDDQCVFVWDKQTSGVLEELKGHDAQVQTILNLNSIVFS
jgi:WD40 repeat protein